MWKYNYTNEMFKKPVKETELYHSDRYLGVDYSDGIKHFKYIKRERRNGRWVYYYKDNSKEYQDLLTKYSKADSKLDDAERRLKNNKIDSKYYDAYYNKTDKDAYESIRKKWKYRNKKNNTEWYEIIKRNNYGYKADKADIEAKLKRMELKKIKKDLDKSLKKEEKLENKLKKAKKNYKDANRNLKKEQISSATIGKASKVAVKGLNAAEKGKQAVAKLFKKKKKK